MIIRGFVYDVTTGRLREVHMTGDATRLSPAADTPDTDGSKA